MDTHKDVSEHQQLTVTLREQDLENLVVALRSVISTYPGRNTHCAALLTVGDCHYALTLVEIIRSIKSSGAPRIQPRNEEFVAVHKDTFATLQRDLAEARSALQWQPIETAPKDGTEVLIAVPKYNHIQNGVVLMTAFWDQIAWASNSDTGGALHEPTHWRELPPPPAPDRIET